MPVETGTSKLADWQHHFHNLRTPEEVGVGDLG